MSTRVCPGLSTPMGCYDHFLNDYVPRRARYFDTIIDRDAGGRLILQRYVTHWLTGQNSLPIPVHIYAIVIQFSKSKMDTMLKLNATLKCEIIFPNEFTNWVSTYDCMTFYLSLLLGPGMFSIHDGSLTPILIVSYFMLPIAHLYYLNIHLGNNAT